MEDVVSLKNEICVDKNAADNNFFFVIYIYLPYNIYNNLLDICAI